MSTIRVVRIHHDPSTPIQEQVVEDELSMWQNAVGGYIESVILPERADLCMFANEEGAISVGGRGPLPLNHRATLLARQPICGPVILFGLPIVDGEAQSVPEGTAARLAGMFRCAVEVVV